MAVNCTICAVLLILVGLFSDEVSSQGSEWSYDGHHGPGPAQWSDKYPLCGGSSQSPVNIEVDELTPNDMLGGFVLSGYIGALKDTQITNNGHTAVVNVGGTSPAVAGGGLSDSYNLVQLHVHWGTDSSRGSEHTVNGHRYAAEVHFVHMKQTYATTTEALAADDPDALAVLGVFVQESDVNNTDYQPITDSLSKIVDAESTANVTEFSLRGLLPRNTVGYYRYRGSLTTPTCNQAVIWTLFTEPVELSKEQLSLLRGLHVDGGEPLVDNYRPVQPLNDRVIYTSFHVTSSATHVISGLSCVLMTFLVKCFV